VLTGRGRRAVRLFVNCTRYFIFVFLLFGSRKHESALSVSTVFDVEFEISLKTKLKYLTRRISFFVLESKFNDFYSIEYFLLFT